ncbi:MAG: hypothetical protein LBU89_11800 [Fibromonadaceae bacterium]|jgi:hypothetical protein|nr:hypothetical protein [Fibromonadaceae bacterium]
MVWVITVFALVFVIAAAGAKRRAGKRHYLPLENPALSLAILKENLLENPNEQCLQKLKDFATLQNLILPKEEYPVGKAPSIEQDDSLFSIQAAWLDSLTPLEFIEEPQTEKTLLNGILRLYSDKAIFSALKTLQEKFPSEKSKALEQSYKELCELRDSSKADYNSLERLRMEKEKWERLARE